MNFRVVVVGETKEEVRLYKVRALAKKSEGVGGGCRSKFVECVGNFGIHRGN